MSDIDNVVNCCRELLLNFPEAKDVAIYADNRLSKEGQEKFSFGYFPNNKNLGALVSMVGEDTLIKLDLLYDKIFQDDVSYNKTRHSNMENHNLIMPYRDLYGNIVAIVGRSILDGDRQKEYKISKYKNTSFTKGHHLFGLFEAKTSIIRNNIAYIVEGQFDCITAQCKGLENVVALGSSNMTFDQFALLYRYTNNIILLLDNDDAGNVGAEKIINTYGKYANIRQVILPKGFKDIDEYLASNDVESLNFALK